MDINSRDPSQNIIPFRIKGVDVARFDTVGNLGIGTTTPTTKLDVSGAVQIVGSLNIINTNIDSNQSAITINGVPFQSNTNSAVVVNIDSQPAPATAVNRQKKQSIPISVASTLSTGDVVAKMTGVSVGKSHTYGVGPAQMASYGNIVVAVGEGTNSIAYSLTNPPTAASWVGIPGIFSTRGRNIAYANGTWVAVGDGTNSIAYSTMTPPVASSWVVIPTGTSINNVTNTFNTTQGINIAYGNGAWVAVGMGTNGFAYSLANPPTAESWVGIPLSFSPTIFGSNVVGITFANGIWVATGLGTNSIAYSTRTPPTADSWVVVPTSNTNDAGVNNTFTNQGISNIIYANGVWLVGGSGTNTLCYSVENPPIAGSWMPITNSVLFGASIGRSIAYGNGTWVAWGDNGLFAYSTSRIPHSSSWVSMKGPTPSSSNEVLYNITFNAATNTWYFTGDIGTNCMFYSTATPPVPATWVGVPQSTSTFTTQAWGAIGITTNAFTSPINVARLDNKVTFPANRMLAVGGGSDVLARSALTPSSALSSTISYSDDDGATWQMVPGGATNSMFSSAADISANTSFGVGGSRGANAVAWNGEKWVAAGNGRTHSLAFSDDGGMTWSGVTGKSIFSVEARDVAWNGQMWVAVGRGAAFSTAYSYDGVTWMGPIDASGAPINVFSLDIAGPTAATSDISGGGNHVIWTGKMWVATGTRTLIAGSSPAAYYTIAYSTDGKTWTGVPDSGAASTGFDIYAHGVAWNGRNYIATGRGTVNTLVYFTDVTATSATGAASAVTASWQGLGNSVFSVWGRGITWGARRWMATGRGTNTVAYSTNGRNWQGCGANVFKPMRRFMAMGDTGVYSGQRGVAFSYSDDGITWDAPVVNQGVEFSLPIGGTSDATRSVIFTNNILLTNAVTDNTSAYRSIMYSADGGASWARVLGTGDTETNGGTGMTHANNGTYSLAMNPTRTRFLVGGGDSASATRKVYFSNDGFNWRNSISSPNSTQMAWVFASLWIGGSYNRWLIGGSDATTNSNGRIMRSGDADANTAWGDTITFTNNVVSCFGANLDFSVILAGAMSGNVIFRSINGGLSWTTVPINGTPTGSVRSIAFAASLGRWVAVGGAGATNTIIYSTDATGTAWIAPPLQAKTAATAIFKNNSEATRVIWDAVGGRFIVGGWNGGSESSLTNVAGLDGTNNNPGYTMAYSADGINWTPVTVRSSDDTGNSTGVSISGPFLTRCRDLMALDTAGDFTPVNTGYSVTWNSYANRFVATGNGTCPVVYSNDGGVTWTPANQQPPQQAIAVAGGVSAAASTTSVSPLTYTIDGKTWFQGLGAKEIFGTGAVNAVEYGQTSKAISPTNGRIWVAGGAHTSGTSCLAFSQNGIRWTAITNGTTMMTNVRTIVYAPAEQITGNNNAVITATSGVGNGVWIAGGDTTNSLIFSYDGISWSEVPNSLTILSRCNAIAFGNGLFVAGGIAATGTTAVDTTANMFYSTDGIAWRPIRNSMSRISPNASISSIAYGRDENDRGIWVAGASTASSSSISVLYSYNGVDWTGVTNSGSTIGSLGVTSITYGLSASTGRGLWIAGVNRTTGDGNAFVVSTNGRDGWTAVSNTKTGLFDVSGGGPTSISYLNGIWYATGSSAGISTGRTLAYSYDGSGGWFGVYPTTNIYGSSIITFSITDMRCVATTNDYIIPSCASAGSSVSSGTAAASFRPAGMTTVRSIGWTAGVGSAYLQHPTILVGGENGRSVSAISADGGRTWGSSTTSLARSAFRGGVCNDIFWNGSTWVAVGHDAVSGAKVATSKDGVSWTQIPGTSIPITGVLNTIAWNGSMWMVGGDGSPTNDANTASFAWSSNLTSWNAITNTDISLTVVKRIAWNGMYWVAVGQGSGVGANATTIMYSKNRNGLVWEDTFTAASSTTKTSAITTIVNDIVWGGGRWVAVGRGNSVADGSGVSILYSADTGADYAVSGRRWVGVAASAQLFPYGANSIAWNGKRFIATGPASASCSTGNIIAWSADGISWNGYSTAKTVAPGQRWVAVGSGSRACIAISTDGRVWTDVANSAALFSDISGASTALVNTMKTGARAVGWNGSSLIVGGARSATTVTPASQATANSTIGRTTIPVCAFIGSGNGVMGGGTTNTWNAATHRDYTRVSSSVFITHMDVNIREANSPWANMWLNTYTDLSATQLFQVTPEMHTFSSALKWNGWSWVANFGLTTNNPLTGEQYGSIWYCTDPLARVGWSVASNSANPRILIGQGGYAALEWNGVAWLACGYDLNNNNLIYTTDKYGAIGWTAVSGIVSGAGFASFQPVCIASSSRFWVVGGSQGTTSAMYFTSDRTGATGWRAIATTGGSVLPGIRISSVAYNGNSWICCGGGGGGSGSPASSISWRADTGANEDIGTGWATATISGTSGGIPPVLANGSSIAYNTGASSPIWVVVGDVSLNTSNQLAYTATVNGSTEWKVATGTLTNTLFGRLTGITWTGYSWIATSAAGSARILSTMDTTAATRWNTSPTQSIYSPTLNTNAVTFANIPISLLTTGMPTSAGAGAGTGAMWRAGTGRAQGILTGGGTETTSVLVRSSNGAEGTSWSQTYARNFLIAVGGGAIRDASNGGGTNRMAFSYDGGLSWTTNNTSVLTNAASNSIGTIRTVKYGNGIWVAGGDAAGSSVSGNNCLAWSRDGVNWTGAGGTQIFGSAGACYAVCCNDRGRWVAVGGSPLTTAGTYTNTSGSIYTMAWSDDGQNWTPILGSRALFGIVCQGVSYGADASGVGMWTAIGRGTAYTGCAYSYDGKTWFLSQTSGSLFGTSANVLTERYAPVGPVVDWKTVSMNSTGQYQFVGMDNGLVYRSMDYGVTWAVLTLPSRKWASVAVSSTGQYVVAASSDGTVDRLYNSSDHGVTWVGRGYASDTWVQVAISATGQFQVGVCSNILAIQISRNYGVTWTSTDATGQPRTGIAISSSGQYITAVTTGNPRVSSDYGVTFSNGNTSTSYTSIAMSSTGQIQIAGTTGTSYVSINYGVTWTTSSMPGSNHRSVAISSTGQYRSGVITTADTIKRTHNNNSNWISVGVSANYSAISMSATGQYQTAVSTGTGSLIYISSNFGETWSAATTDSRSLGVAYGKDANGAGMWVVAAGRRDRDVAATSANTMAYSYDGKLWRGITAAAGLSEQAWSVAYGKDGYGVGMWVAAGYDVTCGLKWSYDGINWNASTGASGASVWTGMAAGRRALSVYWNGSMWLASTSDTRNGEPGGSRIAANNASSVPGYLLYSYNGKNWLPVLASNTYDATLSTLTQTSIYSVLPNPAILDFGSFYDDQAQRGVTIANTTARTVGAVMSGGVPVENVNTIVPYGKGLLTTGQVPFLLGGDSGLVETATGVVGVAGAGAPPLTSDLASATTSLSTSTDGGITWRAVPNSTKVMTKVNKILCDETTQQIVAVGTGNYSVATSTPSKAADADGWVGVFGSRMTDTRAGLFEKYGTDASWFGGAKMWIASGRAQSRRGSSLAVSVNGTVWQDAKIVSQVAAGSAGAGRGGGLLNRTTNTITTSVVGMDNLAMTNTIVPYTASSTPLITYTDSAAAFSTQVSAVAVNSQYNRAVVGGSSVQFVAGGSGGSLAYSDDGEKWASSNLLFQSQTNTTTRTGSGGFDASFGTVALTQRLTTPTAYASGNYNGFAVNETGQYQTAIINGGLIYTSSDYGVNWTSRIDSTNRSWNSLGMSSSGQYQTAGVSFGQIYTSSDFGATWTTRELGAWTGLSVSSTGQYQTAVYENGSIFTSDDYGVYWTARSFSPAQLWSHVSISSTGQYQSAVSRGITNANTTDSGIWISSDYGISWSRLTPGVSKIWVSISISSSGQYQTALADNDFIYTSSNFGMTWTARTSFNASWNWPGVSVSSTGQYQTAVGFSTISNGYIYTSSDFGVTWTPKVTDANRAWRCVSISGSGQFQCAGVDVLYTSSDFGNTWVRRSTATQTNQFTRVRSSASGQYQLATSGPVGNTNGQLYVSSNYGQSWIPRRGLGAWLGGAVSATGAIMTTFSTPTAATATIIRSIDYGTTFSEISGTTLAGSAYWRAISATNSAALQTAVAYGGAIYRSSDYGASWSNAGITIDGNVNASLPRNWQDVAISAETGAVQVTCVNSGYLYVSNNNGTTWTESVNIDGVATQTTDRVWRAVAISANGQYGLACVNNGYLYISINNGTSWISSTVNIDSVTPQSTNRAWQDVGMSANGKYQVACVASGLIYYSKNYGASWTSLTAAGSRSWSSVALSENGSTISATTNDSTGGVWVYSMPDDQYYQPSTLTNTGGATTATVRAITYGNSGTGAAVDGYWVAGSDASANSLAYSSNGIDWTAVVGSKTTLFNAVNGVAYGADAQGTPMWVAVGQPFVGSIPGLTTYSIAYSYNMTTWVGVRNAANFTGQGNHVAYGQDEFGAGMWVAVGQSDGVLSANLGDSSLYNSNGATNTTIFYSYDGANWAAATGAGVFATSGTDIVWGVDASGVGMWVATGIGFTNPLTGAFITGGQVAHSTNGRVWTPIRAAVPITPPVTLSSASRVIVIPPPPPSMGFVTPTGNTWSLFGQTIPGVNTNEKSGYSVSLSADGTIVAIGASGNSSNKGITRIHKYDAATNTWPLLGPTIPGVDTFEQSGISVSLSADGTTVAIGASGNSSNKGITRIHKYDAATNTWPLLVPAIPGLNASEQSGSSVSLSADGTIVAIGAHWNSSLKGITRIYKYDASMNTWPLLGPAIPGLNASEMSGYSVSLSAHGTTVAIGAPNNNGGIGITRIHKYDASMNTWPLLGPMIPGVDASEKSGWSVSLSADGTTVAIGAQANSSNKGITRIYKYNAETNTWPLLGPMIPGVDTSEQSGWSVSLSADGTTVAIGAFVNNASRGITRIYKYDAATNTWPLVGPTIPGVNAGEHQSGYSVSLSANGTTVAIGAPASMSTGSTHIYRNPVYVTPTFSSSNPAVAEINKALLFIKEGASGTSTIIATQPATPPFTFTPTIVEGTLNVSGTTYTLTYHTFYPIYTPFPSAVAGDSLAVAYGRAGTRGTGAPMWMVGGSGGTNVFAMLSAPTTIGTWSVVASNAANAPFPVCNSLGYSNGVWVAGNNTSATNLLARSIDGGATWNPISASSLSGILAGAAALGANAFCNYSLAVADYSNDTNLRSWNAVQGTKNFMFDGGVNTVATPTPNILASAYNTTSRAWWVAGGRNHFIPLPNILYSSLPGSASIAYTTDPSGVTGWTLGTSNVDYNGNGITDLEQINHIAFSPHTQGWLAVGVGTIQFFFGPKKSALYSANGINWSSAVVSEVDDSLILNTCAWNQLDASASAAGRWIAGGTRSGVDGSAISLYISTDINGESWRPIVGTGAILSQVYSLGFNGTVWIAAGTPATSNGSTSTLMRTTDITGATGWQGIAATNVSTSGFDTAARSITWNAEQQMWIATGENTGTTADASFSSIIYSRDINGATGTWRSVRESNSFCLSGEGMGIAFNGDRWFAAGQGTNQIVATTGATAASAARATWTPITHGTALTSISDIAYTGRRLIATGSSTSGTSNGVIYTTDNSGSVWTAAPATPGPGFTDALGGGTSITFEPSLEGGAGHVVATGRSATNALSISTDGGISWSSPSVQFSTTTLYANYNSITTRTQTVGFPVLNSLPNWIIDISFTKTGGDGSNRVLLGSMYNNVDSGRGWGILVSTFQDIYFSAADTTYTAFSAEVSTNIAYNLNVTKVGTLITFRLTNLSTKAVLTNTITLLDTLGLGPVEIGGNSTGETFTGTIGYVVVSDHFKNTPSATTQPLFTTGGNSVAYVGNDTLFAGGANDVQWTGKRWVATGRNSSNIASSVTSGTPSTDVINNNTSTVATSDDGITWQSVGSSQAPNLSEGTVIVSNSRIGPTPLINSQIVISDGGDTESNADYGGMTCGMGGSGTGVAQIDIIAELPPVSNAASSGAVTILGAAGNAQNASFDTTAFAIITRPI